MKLFRHENRERSAESRRLYAVYTLAGTFVDFCAALLFLAGSILFFWDRLETVAIWCFVAGSVCFALRPTIRLAREIRLARDGDVEGLARQSRLRE